MEITLGCQDVANSGIECFKWTDNQIITYVMAHARDGFGMNLTIDSDEAGPHVTAVVDYDGPNGLVTIDGEFVATGYQKSTSGMRLHLSEKVYTMGEFPRVRWIHKIT
ncbi:hypothetical protein QC762_0000800 [Podospora pseudocomata]|uniref:Uncharacterized protein n=1 Tax=Podospora pseudocomata TaxID=2093779 RepID=A0ABR0GSB5_9PEZI|nr:hypothetical protein QC762_0000800 [Podospora pseudocomata]